jgi:hypothetical protein
MFVELQQNAKESKAEMTNRIARDIIRADARKLATKSERLREARLAAERDAPVEPVKKPVRSRAKAK